MVKNYIITIDLGGTNLRIALLNLKYRIIAKKVLSTRRFHKKESLILAIVESVKDFLKSSNLSNRQILGLGLGLPGPIDAEKGLVHFFPNIPGWKEVHLKSILQKKLNLPVFLDNDANLMALAEYKLGAARGARNALCLTLGTGVGGGIIIDGNLYRASSFAAGEIGHLPINEHGPKCNCGGVACLEAYIGNNRIKAMARKIFKREISLEELSNLAQRKNKKAKGIWLEVGKHLGVALVGVVNLLNPDCIVIGGGVANAGKILFDRVKEIVAKQAMATQAKHVKIFKAKLGSDAGLIGAAVLVRQG
ncbi:MAG: ROK family protein [Candidatus Omnitrophica bacterium]|nr:ROK family protein [Candidatus Omnitrophota bacterium]